MNGKEFLFVALTTAVAIIFLEPLIEKAIAKVSPTAASKLGIAA